ncbi:unnamed protein product [Closterium sp. Yama58-4]|nr:unnamed protein product [Closterium sp. Yama58-4]
MSSAFTASSLSSRIPTSLASTLPRHVSSSRVSRLVVRASSDDEEFEARLERLRRKNASGTGKKAEERKAKASGDAPPASASSSASSTSDATSAAAEAAKIAEILPPLPLKDPVSDGLPVLLGFSAYTERLSGRLAAIGLAALVSVELASGSSILEYHDGATLAVQVYFLLGLGALYVKYEKDKSSVLPKKQGHCRCTQLCTPSFSRSPPGLYDPRSLPTQPPPTLPPGHLLFPPLFPTHSRPPPPLSHVTSLLALFDFHCPSIIQLPSSYPCIIHFLPPLPPTPLLRGTFLVVSCLSSSSTPLSAPHPLASFPPPVPSLRSPPTPPPPFSLPLLAPSSLLLSPLRPILTPLSSSPLISPPLLSPHLLSPPFPSSPLPSSSLLSSPLLSPLLPYSPLPSSPFLSPPLPSIHPLHTLLLPLSHHRSHHTCYL